MKAKKFDQKKPDLTLPSPYLEEAVAYVMQMGLEKYGRDNWRSGKDDPEFHRRTLAAAKRHIAAFLKGNPIDDESGLPHLWHAVTDLSFIIHWQEELKKDKK